VLEQPRAGLGRRHRAAVQQRDLEVAFQRGYLLGNGRLGIAELDRRGVGVPPTDGSGQNAPNAIGNGKSPNA
jgi:hypothetical protein